MIDIWLLPSQNASSLASSNRHGVIQGHLDTPLNDYGRNEAQFLARRLASVKFDEAWSSSLSRAKEAGRSAYVP